jgi:hypothetical protein
VALHSVRWPENAKWNRTSEKTISPCRGNQVVIGSSVGLASINALVVIEIGANLLDGQPGNKCWYRPVRVRENRQFLAEHLLNSRLQMRASSATEERVTQTKQTKIGPCEQVRLNWKTATLWSAAARRRFMV